MWKSAVYSHTLLFEEMLSNYICHCSQWMLAGIFQNCTELAFLKESKQRCRVFFVWFSFFFF